MDSITIELNRFGDPEGVLKLSEKYLRAIGNAPIVEASMELKQKDFRRLMKKLDYDRFRLGSPEAVRREAEEALAELIEPISRLLPLPDSASEELQQIEVVTGALELAQLPLEVLEENRRDIVLTRRVRQPWPRPPVVVEPVPKVLFVWAEPFRKNSTTRRETVPHEAHRALLEEVLADWLDPETPEKTLVEIGNATFDRVKAALRNPDHGFTHVYILAHGRYDDEAVYLLLEGDDGHTGFHSPAELKGIYKNPDLPRPGTVILATCHSGEVDPLEAGGTLGQVLHEAGVPVVLASQFALTQAGSSDLIEIFLALVINGEDPRRALRACRDGLRSRRVETFHDRVALVGYVHLSEDFSENLPGRKLRIALARLEAASRSATRAAIKTTSPSASLAGIRARFEHIRAELQELHRAGIHKEYEEELLGLEASALKREAEVFWNTARDAAPNAARKAPPEEQDAHVGHSREMLRAARHAYRNAAALSRDHHWTTVQSLVLDAAVDGTLDGREWDWIAACQASRDAAERHPDPLERLWGLGSLAELHILAPLVGEEIGFTGAEIDTMRTIAVSEGGWPLDIIIRQLDRYLTWWGADDPWKLPATVLERARVLRDTLTTKMEAHRNVHH
uniref:CHAT domain-containing protein n=1 Tax=Candidatus Kentrum sp. FW TaxID=2126338 RepID=A0A450T9E0_9GAMM|nr:MAG: CHAT domain-containing protein [Candidatus Kentron sp. FW]